MIAAKLLNSRVLVQRQQRKRHSASLELAINSLTYYAQQAKTAETPDKLRGYEGAGAACYYAAFGECLSQESFTFLGRSRRPPTNPVNAMLSFGYQILWNHLLALVELQHLDPFCGVLHTSHHGHAALVSDLLEEFRAPIADSLVLWLINTKMMNADVDFEYRDRGCFLNESGKRKFLNAFVQRMEGKIQISNESNASPRWELLGKQVKCFRQAILDSDCPYIPYRID